MFDRNTFIKRKYLKPLLLVILVLTILVIVYYFVTKPKKTYPINKSKFRVEETKTGKIKIISSVKGAKMMCVSTTTDCEDGSGWVDYQTTMDGKVASISSKTKKVYAWYRKYLENEKTNKTVELVLNYEYQEKLDNDKIDKNVKKEKTLKQKLEESVDVK